MYLVLAAAMLSGLLVYEHFGWRLGGVLVLPLILVYGLVDARILLAFAAATLLAYLTGTLLHRTTLLYGRRLLYIYMVVGLLSAAVAIQALGVDIAGVALAVLPGVFAFNVHREGRPVQRVAQFLLFFLPAYLLAHFLLLPMGFGGGLFPYVPGFQGLVVETRAAVTAAGAAPSWPGELLVEVADGTSVGLAVHQTSAVGVE